MISKILFLTFLYSFCLCLVLSGQSCLPEGILFYGQSEIDNFPTNYPDCKHIEGFVEINLGFDSIHNLDSLSQIESIGQGLLIQETDLTSLAGLDNLKSVGGTLNIKGNYELTSLEHLSSLEEIGGLRISTYDTLFNLSGLSILNQINGDIYITGFMTSLEGINWPETIKGDLVLTNNSYLKSLTL